MMIYTTYENGGDWTEYTLSREGVIRYDLRRIPRVKSFGANREPKIEMREVERWKLTDPTMPDEVKRRLLRFGINVSDIQCQTEVMSNAGLSLYATLFSLQKLLEKEMFDDAKTLVDEMIITSEDEINRMKKEYAGNNV